MFIKMWLMTMETPLNHPLIVKTFDFTSINLTQVRMECKFEFNSLDKIN